MPVYTPASRLYGPYAGKDNLNLGCALNHESGFTNLDCDERACPDVIHDLEVTPLPFPDSSFDLVLGPHVFEHIRNIIPLVADIHRILRPGGYLVAVVPHAGCDSAWDSPAHVRSFTAATWTYFDRRTYEKDHSTHGAWQGALYRDWDIIGIMLIPHKEFTGDQQVETKARHWRNVINEIHVTLKAVKQ